MNAPSQVVEQKALWNGPAGQAWIEGQELMDRLLEPFERLLAEAVRERGARRVLDIGCGTGATTLAAARVAGSGAHVTGIDISEPMIAVARERARREASTARFVSGDAQTYEFESASMDLFISRFGVMFFEDPTAAFANLRRAAAPGATTRLIAWRSAAENPFMTTAERAAAQLLPQMPPRKPDGPGQFAFADADRVRGLLGSAGWVDVELQAIDVPCVLRKRDLDEYLLRLGPVGMALREADEATRQKVGDAVRAAFAPYVQGDEVRFIAACWMINGDIPDFLANGDGPHR